MDPCIVKSRSISGAPSNTRNCRPMEAFAPIRDLIKLAGSRVPYWNKSGGGLYYIWGSDDELLSYQLQSNNIFKFVSYDTRSNAWPTSLALSANGSSGGVLWAVASQSNGAGTSTSPATILYASNATATNGKLPELWDSTQNANRDALGDVGRFAVPTVVNGKIFVASGSNQVYVYGLLPASPPSFEIVAQRPTLKSNLGRPGTITDTLTVNALGGFTGSVALSVSGLPAGATGTVIHPL